jgi:dienelactone hydrolase
MGGQANPSKPANGETRVHIASRRKFDGLALSMLAFLMVFSPLSHAASLRDEKILVPKGHGLFHVELETRLYAPLGDGPFPLVVINHGKNPGEPRFQSSSAFYGQALEFVRRGYAVIAPMRQGFAGSSGFYLSAGSNIEDTGLAQADDIAAAIDYAKTVPFIDASRIVVIGQSAGGLATIALGSRNPPGVLGLISFAGGLRFMNTPGAERNLVVAYGDYGKTTTIPSLWMYGENDSLFPPPLAHRMLDAYNGAGGHAQFVDFGSFGDDAHAMFGSFSGTPIWLPQVEKFLASLGLPVDIRYDLRSHSDGPDIEDVSAVPNLNDAGREGYRRFLWSASPRAFALSENGHWASRTGPDAQKEALDGCAKRGGLQCRLYAVDQELVSPAGK